MEGPAAITLPTRKTAAAGQIVALALHGIAQAGAILLGVFGVAIIWIGLHHSLTIERRQAMRSAFQNTANLSRAFEENIIRSVKAIDQTLLFVRDTYEADPTRFNAAAWTRNTHILTDLTFQISVIDKNGFLVTSNLAQGGTRMDLSDRQHFRVHRDSSEDLLFISQPVFGRASHKWSVQLTRKVIAADGSFDGVVVVSLDPQYLSRFYDSVDLGRQGVVILTGIDGIVRASASAASPGGDAAIGKSIADGRLMTAYAASPAGTFDAASRLDGVKRIYAYRGVRGFPLIVGIGVAEDEVLAFYEINRQTYFLLALLLSALLAAVTGLVLVRQSRLNRARRQLRVSEAGHAEKSRLLHTALEHMSQGILMIDADRRVQVCNHRAIAKLGLPEALMLSKPHFDDVLSWQWENGEFGDQGSELDPTLRGFVLGGGMSDQPQTYERTRRNGLVLEIRSAPLPGGGVVRTYTDITARKETEAILRAARDQADQAAQAKSAFLATMSHEIRSPMSGLMGVLEILRGTSLDAEQSRMARMLHGSASALLAVLNDILDFSKIEAGHLAVTPAPTCLRDVVGDLIQPHAVAARHKAIELRLTFDEAVPAVVETDALRLGQILNNLLANALKFTPSGEIALHVDTTANAAGAMLRFTVSDTGIGMDADVLSRLFQPFMQADGSTTRDYGGTGLGLSISRRLAHLLDGELDAASVRGGGSTFSLLLPSVPSQGADADGVAERQVVGPDRVPGGTRALVVDDDPTNRWLSQRQLELLGLTVDVAAHGQAALIALQTRQYDLLVTDCHMPVMDGVALTRAVREASDPVLRRIPVIGLTADVTPGQRERCREAGMNDVAIKPVGLQRLSGLVLDHLGHLDRADLAKPDAVAASPAAEPVAFDTDLYSELFAPGDADGAAWLNEFLDTAAILDDQLPAWHDGAVARDEAVALAHRLAGAALSVGATRLGLAARALEQAAANQAPSVLRDLHATVTLELAAARAAMAAFVPALQRHHAPAVSSPTG